MKLLKIKTNDNDIEPAESAMGCKMNAQYEESEYVDAVKE
jgi:hypothetical protein